MPRGCCRLHQAVAVFIRRSLQTPKGIYTGCCCLHQAVAVFIRRSLQTPRGISTGCCCLHQVVTANAKRNTYRLLLSSSGGHCKRQEEYLQVVAVFIRWSLQTPRGIPTACYCRHRVVTANTKWNIYRLILWSLGGHSKRQEEYRVVIVVIFILLSSSSGHRKRQEEY